MGHRGVDLAAASGPAVRLAELPYRTAISLRLDPGGAAAHRVGATLSGAVHDEADGELDDGPGGGLRSGLGGALPGPGAAATAGERGVLWLGPDEWLVTGPDGEAGALVRLLTDALGDEHGSVVDVSAHRTTLELAGPSAREVLEKGVTLDLHPRVFGVGQAAATTLARTHVILWQVGEEPTYHLLVRSSFAGYLADWLIDAAAEFTTGRTGAT